VVKRAHAHRFPENGTSINLGSSHGALLQVDEFNLILMIMRINTANIDNDNEFQY
jgi:hypothetical protein